VLNWVDGPKVLLAYRGELEPALEAQVTPQPRPEQF
jgi:hypothetical protein